jgi:hypothetical protein
VEEARKRANLKKQEEMLFDMFACIVRLTY